MKVAQVHGQGGDLIYTVSSKFKQAGVAAPFVVTLVLNSRRRGNSFYDKHVLREGESSRTLWDERKGTMTNAGFDPAKAAAAADKGIYTGATQSTFIRLKNIDFNLMIYGLAKCMVENYRAGAWGGVGAYVLHLPTKVQFDQVCVVSYTAAGAKSYHQTMQVGGRLEAAAGNLLTFDLNHCGGN